jgi:hypothetical protein
MRKQLLFMVVLLSCAIDSIAQDSIYFSEQFKFSRNTISYTALPANDSKSYYSLEETAEKNSQLIIKNFSIDGRQKWMNAIEIPLVNDEEIDISEYHTLGDSILVFGTVIDRDANLKRAVVFSIFNSGTSFSQPIQLSSIDRESASSLGVSFSPDSTQILIYFDRPTPKKTDKDLMLCVFSRSFQFIWEKALQLPYTNDIVQIHQYFIDNLGGVYLLSGKNPQKNIVRQVKTQGGRYLVFYFNNATNKLKEYDISLKDKQVVSAMGLISPSNEMLIGGYYSSDYSFSIAGTFFFAINASGGSMKTATYMAFPKTFMDTMLSEREMERAAELNDFYLDNVIYSNGALLLIGEKFYVTERVNTDINTGRVIVENIYHYDDLIVTRLEMSGKIAWSQRVAKEQYSSTEYDRCGYNVFLRDTTLAFVFNDDKENTALLLKDPKARLESWNGSRTSTITLIELNNSGVALRSTLATEEMAEGSITPELGSSEIYRLPVLGFTKGRDFRFATFFKK